MEIEIPRIFCDYQNYTVTMDYGTIILTFLAIIGMIMIFLKLRDIFNVRRDIG